MTIDQINQLSALLKQQTGKSMEEIDDMDEFFDSLEFTINNDNVLRDALAGFPLKESQAIKLWRQAKNLTEIRQTTNLTFTEIVAAIEKLRSLLYDAHFEKFTKGWTLNRAGQPVSANPPGPTNLATARMRFNSWMMILAIDRETH